MDKEKIKRAVSDILEAIGEDITREGLLDTPSRVADMYEQIFPSYENTVVAPPAYFHGGTYSEIILVKDIYFHSVCEHHLLPFYGKAHIAYIPDSGRITGLSKIARLVESVAGRLQLQERMTEVIADSMVQNIKPLGAMVVIEAEHLCMIMRGVKKPGSKVLTSAMRGIFLKDARTRAEALALIKDSK